MSIQEAGAKYTSENDIELGFRTNSYNSASTESSKNSISFLNSNEHILGSQSQSQSQSQTLPSLTQLEAQDLPPVTALERRLAERKTDWTTEFKSKHPKAEQWLTYFYGPSPPIQSQPINPWFPRIEHFLDSLCHPLVVGRRIVIPLYLIAWFLAFTFFVRAVYFPSFTRDGSVKWIQTTDTYWTRNDECGLDGLLCQPFTNETLTFRCPIATTQLLNIRMIGAEEVIWKPLVVGGGDALGTYRADTWICYAAIQQGLFKASTGGCGQVELVGGFTNYIASNQNGVESVGFDTYFPSSFRVSAVEVGTSCRDLKHGIVGMNAGFLGLFSLVIRPVSSILYWVIYLSGFWTVVMASYPTQSPPNVEIGFKYFLPSLFIAYAFWRFSFRYVMPAFHRATIERTVYYLGPFWFGLLLNETLEWIPVTRLTPQDIQRQPGGLIAVIVIVLFIFFAVLNQLRVIRRTGWLPYYLKWHLVGLICVSLLFTLPNLTFRLHHYILAIVLMPGCGFVTRPSAVFQGFLLGMFLNGAARWGFDSILQTAASLVGDGAKGDELPVFITNATNFIRQINGTNLIEWERIPDDLSESWNSFSLIIDDVLAWTGNETTYNVSGLDSTLTHYFRLAYSMSGSNGDFTKAAVLFTNGTWQDPQPGAS